MCGARWNERAAVRGVELRRRHVAGAVHRLGDAAQAIAGQVGERLAGPDALGGGQTGDAEVLGDLPGVLLQATEDVARGGGDLAAGCALLLDAMALAVVEEAVSAFCQADSWLSLS